MRVTARSTAAARGLAGAGAAGSAARSPVVVPLLLFCGAITFYTLTLPLPGAFAGLGGGGAAAAVGVPPPGVAGSSAVAAGRSLAAASDVDLKVAALQEQVAALQASSAEGVQKVVGEAQTAHAALVAQIEELRAQRPAAAAPCAACPPPAAPCSAVVVPPLAAACPAAPPCAAAPGAKSAILGMAKGIDLQNAYQFVRSLRNHMPADRVDVFLWADAASVSPELELVYAAHSITVVQFDLAQVYTAESAPQRKYHPSSYRWMLMRDFMRSLELSSGFAHREGKKGTDGRFAPRGAEERPPYAQVMFVDVRDTVWQDDVFRRAQGREGLTVFMEQRPKTILECGWNSKWVAACFGDAALQAVGGNIISCSGTSLGTWDDAMAYAQMVGDLIESRPDCEQNGIDQGVHNYFLHSGRFGGEVASVFRESNEEGFVATVQSMSTLNRDRLGRVLNGDGRDVVALVHQYDRSPVLVLQFAREYTWLQPGDLSVPKG